jgi:esterase/lipase superfamily enzyme
VSSEPAVVTALTERWDEISALLAGDLPAFEAGALPLLRKLDASPNDSRALRDLLALLRKFPAVYKLLVAAAGGSAARSFRSAGGAATPAAAPASPASGAPERGGAIGESGRIGAAAPSNAGRYTVVPVFYATDRKHVGDDEYFSGARGELRFGTVRVSIPDDHKLGELEKPRWWRLEFRPDPARHVMVLGLDETDEIAWKSQLRASLKNAGRDDILLFIHGYNVSFVDAARRAAQFAYDLNFKGVPALYSWPSEDRTVSYTIDENNAHWTLEDFEKTFRILLQESGAATVHAVAHSMGNRVLTEGIRRISADLGKPGWARLRELIFAAPDVDADTFRKFAETFRKSADRLTLYASSADKALEASQKIHRYDRAGDSGDGILIVDGVESIDASAVDTSLLGHSYFGDNRSVVSDIYNMLQAPGKSASERFGMRKRETPRGAYFLFRP